MQGRESGIEEGEGGREGGRGEREREKEGGIEVWKVERSGVSAA